MRGGTEAMGPVPMSRSATPYATLPPFTRWSRGFAAATADVDPVVRFPMRLTATDRVATAGSCFAQHISRHLAQRGMNYFVVEDGHPMGMPELRAKHNYGTFSARTGNIYSARQLLQLLRRAFGSFEPVESIWTDSAGRFRDPFRPNIEPDGFAYAAELLADREQHLRAVREMFEQVDCFIFTLGLTEMWACREDGAILPVCPGVCGGEFSAERYKFENARVGEIIDDLRAFVTELSGINPRAKVILTVSPVPLVATAEDRHVLVSTTYSKSALRAACEEVVHSERNVYYFPSYEIITGSYSRGGYFAEDLRSVTERGVEHVMRLFATHVLESGVQGATSHQNSEQHFVQRVNDIIKVVCEEELVEASFYR